MSRWIRFLIVLLLGLAVGLLYAWVFNPVEYVDTTPDTLRMDYKTDYVLMTAEAYGAEGDLNQAQRRLALLGDLPPDELALEAVRFAERAGYTEADLELMRTLSSALLAEGGATP